MEDVGHPENYNSQFEPLNCIPRFDLWQLHQFHWIYSNQFQSVAGHRVQFADGGRPEAAFEYDWAYEDWHADNPEDKLSLMLLGAMAKGTARKNEQVK